MVRASRQEVEEPSGMRMRSGLAGSVMARFLLTQRTISSGLNGASKTKLSDAVTKSQQVCPGCSSTSAPGRLTGPPSAICNATATSQPSSHPTLHGIPKNIENSITTNQSLTESVLPATPTTTTNPAKYIRSATQRMKYSCLSKRFRRNTRTPHDTTNPAINTAMPNGEKADNETNLKPSDIHMVATRYVNPIVATRN